MEELMVIFETIKPCDLGKSSGAVMDSVSEILDLGHAAEGMRLVMKNSRGENMGTISYQFYDQDSDYSNCKICYINFFGTQNGKKESYYAKKLDSLGEYSGDSKHIAYDMMRKFIQDICIPRGIEKIYLDADGSDKKVFWKEKMGTYLIQHDLIRKQYSQFNEVCYVLII